MSNKFFDSLRPPRPAPPAGTPIGEVVLFSLVDWLVRLVEGEVRRRVIDGWPARQSVPAPIVALGLKWPCTAQDVRRRFEFIAMAHHPDTGNGALDGAELRRLRDEALAAVEAHERVPFMTSR